MGTLACQAEIGVWVQTQGAFGQAADGCWRAPSSWGGSGVYTRKNFEIACATCCNLVHAFWTENGSYSAVHNAFLNTNSGNAVSMRSGSL